MKGVINILMGCYYCYCYIFVVLVSLNTISQPSVLCYGTGIFRTYDP